MAKTHTSHTDQPTQPSQSSTDVSILNPSDPIPPDVPDIHKQLSTIVTRLELLDGLAAKVASLETQFQATSQQPSLGAVPEASWQGETRNRRQYPYDRPRPPWWDDSEANGNTPLPLFRKTRAKIDFPKFEGGDPRGWALKAEKYFRYFEIAGNSKVEVAAMHLEGDALDLYAWASGEQELVHWEDLVRLFQESYGPPEF